MALTYVPEFFHKLGFKTVSKDTLPEKSLERVREVLQVQPLRRNRGAETAVDRMRVAESGARS